jgi:DNA-binding CsgD family transcriptional regulator
MGQEGPCREHVDEAQACAARAGTRSISTYAQAALGLLELGLSRLENARSELEPLPEVTLSQGLAEPSVVCWQPDWIETNIRIGDLDTAVQALTRFEREAASVNRTWALAAADRCRGLVAADDEFEGHFERAFARYAHTLAPFERARTELCFGERLRRVGERRRAREQLARALHTFRGLRASPWAARAETELAAAGASPARSTHSLSGRGPQEVLTNQELQVALAIADGKSNKEAAAALFLSPKTIEFHLGHIYRKLGIRSRTQLAREMLGPVAQAPDLSGAQGRR